MEKEPQPDSLSTVTVKEYPPSEVYSTSEPPPAYHRHKQATAVQVARIVAVTVVVVSFILGTFMLASAYVQANASCAHLQQELMLLQEAAERFQPPEALVQEEPVAEQSKVNYDQQQPNEVSSTEHNEKSTTKSPPPPLEENEEDENGLDSDTDENDDNENNATPIHIKLPLQLDFDDLAGALIEKNQRSRMNCIVEKKRADEVIDHQPKTLRLPFGLNLTTDPRYEHVTGEKMAIYCESGNEQRHVPQTQSEEVMMHIQPIIIPIAEQQMPMPHPQQVPVHFNPVPQQQQPPVPPMMRGNPMIPPHIIAQHIAQVQRIAASQHAAAQHQQQQQQLHFHPQPPMQHPYQHPIPPQIPRMVQQPPMPPMQRVPVQESFYAQSQRLPIPEEILTQINRLPNEDVIAIQVSEETDEQPAQEQENIESRENRVMQDQQQNIPEQNDRQSYARGLPIHIPVPMMQDVQQPAPEQPRPHYVQPRSIRNVRSVDNPLLHREKRVKRCSCDCAC